MKKSTAFALMILVALLTAVGVYGFLQTNALSVNGNVLLTQEEYDKLLSNQKRFEKVLELEEKIKSDFYEDTSEIDFDEYLLKGLFAALKDPYSTYFTAEEYEEFTRQTTGEFEGIGIHISEREDGYIDIVAPIKGTPGYEVGLKSGDIIKTIDETDVSSLNIKEAVNLMLGKAGTTVSLEVLRDGEILGFDIVRAKVTVPTIESEMKEEKVGYLRINSFDDGKTYDEFMKAYNALLKDGMKRLVLDLRNNPGGSLREVVQIADAILGKGNILTTVYPGEEKETYNSDEIHRFDLPFVVLINKGSASASEILSGAIKDNDAALIIGETSFGKGLVQQIHALNDGTGYKLTIAYYLTPDGININKKGIEPNISYEDIQSKGYAFEDNYQINEEGDGVLQFAIDHLLGKVK